MSHVVRVNANAKGTVFAQMASIPKIAAVVAMSHSKTGNLVTTVNAHQVNLFITESTANTQSDLNNQNLHQKTITLKVCFSMLSALFDVHVCVILTLTSLCMVRLGTMG